MDYRYGRILILLSRSPSYNSIEILRIDQPSGLLRLTIRHIPMCMVESART